MMDYHDLIGERVKVVDKDGDVYIGPLITYEVGLDSDEDFDSIGIKTGEGYYESVPIPDIVSCEVLED
ncbi:hypothetical protein [Paenibacillus riograndensis]|uniref:Uncharacterized protein n=1 Tax=Paenibacillus riograndensis SBR5 TaxID=1073571 RepID=A0A0E3WFZ7_9BACL|nr:hypothetical protein [Paenibacillus riograndensis]CQR51471.1 hypothetical protein PRIO_0219 [Paenibacillus riograndensis SBR5]